MAGHTKGMVGSFARPPAAGVFYNAGENENDEYDVVHLVHRILRVTSVLFRRILQGVR